MGLHLSTCGTPMETRCPQDAKTTAMDMESPEPWKQWERDTSQPYPPTFCFLATKAAGVILPPTLRDCSIARDPGLCLLVPVSPWNFLVHVIG